MNQRKETHPRHQRGAILATSLIAIAGVGVVAAGTVTILQQNSGDVSESARMMQGTSVADSVRLAVLDGRDTDDLNDMYDGAGMDIEITNADTKSGSISVNGTEYGYRFRMGGGGDGTDGEGNLSWGNVPSACEVTNQHGNSGKKTMTCSWDDDATYSDPILFADDDDLEVNFRVTDDSTVTFEDILIVDGTLDFNQSGGDAKICFQNAVGVTDDLKPSPLHAFGGGGQMGCDDSLSEAMGLDQERSQLSVFAGEVAIGGKLQGNQSELTYSDSFDAVSLSGYDGTLADALNGTLGGGWSFDTVSAAD